MSEWNELVEQDWNRREVSDRENWLKMNDFPSSESSCEYKFLRPQVKIAFYEDTIEHSKGCGQDAYQEVI